MLSAAALPTVAVMARPHDQQVAACGLAGARDDARVGRAEDDGSAEADGGDDGFVVGPEVAEASAEPA